MRSPLAMVATLLSLAVGAAAEGESGLMARLADLDDQLLGAVRGGGRAGADPPAQAGAQTGGSSLSLLQTSGSDKPAARPELGVAAGFELASSHPAVGESLSPSEAHEQEEMARLQEEVDDLEAKVGAAEKKAVSNAAFLQKQSKMQTDMLREKLQAKCAPAADRPGEPCGRFNRKKIELDGKAAEVKRTMAHQLQQMDVQEEARQRAEENRVSQMKIELADQESKAGSLQQEADSEKRAAAVAANKQEEEVARMRAEADQMESELRDAELGAVGLEGKIETMKTNVQHAAKAKAKLEAKTKVLQEQAAGGEEKQKGEEAKVDLMLDQTAKEEASAKLLGTKAEELAKQLAKDEVAAAGAKADAAQASQMQAEVEGARAEIHRSGSRAAAELEAFEAAMAEIEAKVQDLQEQKKGLEQQEAKTVKEAAARRKQLVDGADKSRASLRESSEAEDKELLAEMQEEAARAKKEQAELQETLNKLQEQLSKTKHDGKIDQTNKKAQDSLLRKESVTQLENATDTSSKHRIQAEYAAAMARVAALKAQDQAVQNRSNVAVAKVHQHANSQIAKLQSASESRINAIKQAAETKIAALFRAIGLERTQEVDEDNKAVAAAGVARSEAKSAIARAVSGEKGAVADAVKEAISFAQAKSEAAESRAQEAIAELETVIRQADASGTSRFQSLKEKIAMVRPEQAQSESNIVLAKRGLKSDSKSLQLVHSDLAAAAAKARGKGDQILELQAELDKLTNANQMLEAQAEDTKHETLNIGVKLHSKLKLQEALAKQLETVSSHLKAAQTTHAALEKVAKAKEESAKDDETAAGDTAAGTAAAVEALESKAKELDNETAKDEKAAADNTVSDEATDMAKMSTSSVWSRFLGF